MSVPSERLVKALLAELRRSALAYRLEDLVLLAEPSMGRPIPTDEAEEAAEFCARRGWATAFEDDFGARRYAATPLGRAISSAGRIA